ncbi:MAG: YbaK/EbsC family protein [bacterium]|nr:YbaK/EbsC family protein [bacterium]
MSIPKKFTNYLEKNQVKYDVVEHRTVYTAYDLSQTLDRKMTDIAKTLLVKVDNGLALAVLPASKRLDLIKLKKLAKAKKVGLPKENVMKTKLKIKPGAITPFGKMHKLPVYMDASLKKPKKILVGAGSFDESFLITPAALIKLEEPVIGSFSQARKK